MDRAEAVVTLLNEYKKLTASQASYVKCRRALRALGFTPEEQHEVLRYMDFDHLMRLEGP